MKYLIVDIPSEVLPNKRYFLTPNLCIFPSIKCKESRVCNEEIYVSLMFIEGAEGFGKERFNHLIKQYIIFLNFIYPDSLSIKWLNNTNLNDLFQHVEEGNDIEGVFKIFEPTQKVKPDFLYHDFKSFSLPFYKQGYESFIDFEKLFYCFLSLPDDNKLKHRIELYSFLWAIKPLFMKVYDNDNLEISITYTLIDALITDYINKDPVKTRCVNCGHEKISRKSDRTRIKEFAAIISGKDNAKLYSDIMWNLYTIRNDFYHEGIKPLKEDEFKIAYEKFSLKTGKNGMTLYDEVRYNKSRNIGLLNMKIIIKRLLIEKLQDQEIKDISFID